MTTPIVPTQPQTDNLIDNLIPAEQLSDALHNAVIDTTHGASSVVSGVCIKIGRKFGIELDSERIREGRHRVWARSKATRSRKRAVAVGLTEHFTWREWIRLTQYYDNACVFCGGSKGLTTDHVTPLSEGGSNTIDNIQPICGDCRRHFNKSNVQRDFRSSLPDWDSIRDDSAESDCGGQNDTH